MAPRTLAGLCQPGDSSGAALLRLVLNALVDCRRGEACELRARATGGWGAGPRRIGCRLGSRARAGPSPLDIGCHQCQQQTGVATSESMLELHVPRRDKFPIRQAWLADPESMHHNAGWVVEFPGCSRATGCIEWPEQQWDAFEERLSRPAAEHLGFG